MGECKASITYELWQLKKVHRTRFYLKVLAFLSKKEGEKDGGREGWRKEGRKEIDIIAIENKN